MKEKVYQLCDVVECNHAYIHCKADGDEWSVKANADRLQEIYEYANRLRIEYTTMANTLYPEYQRRREEVNKEKIYTPEEIEEKRDWRKYGIGADANLKYHNEQVRERRWQVSGFYDALDWAWNQRDKYGKLAQQAKGGLR